MGMPSTLEAEFVQETGHVFVHGGGWAHYVQGSLRAWIRFAPGPLGRLAPVEMHLAASNGPLSMTSLQRLPLTRIEAFLNQPQHAQAMLDCWRDEHPDLEQLDGWDVINSPRETGKLLTMSHNDVNALLDVPEAKPYGVEFYQQLADAYSRLVQVTRSPAPVIAEVNEVPVTTVHRWVREARRRGLLAAGVRGKVG